jgi:tetratricopeptide (TPR) repeat protein
VETVQQSALRPFTQRPVFAIAVLLAVAIGGFALVTRLVNRYRQQEMALARHLYDEGLTDQSAGRFDSALESFRAALMYDRDNFQYQLSLARALRDSGRTDESETYLVSLWEGNPQDGAVNLALGRLAARRGEVDRALQYYHNAIYGVWSSDPGANRLNAQFELTDFLLRAGARPQAQAELITLSASPLPDSASELRMAQLSARAQDYSPALAAYQRVLKEQHENANALAGAGDAAFHLGNYRLAAGYLQAALRVAPADLASGKLLLEANLVMENDPFARHLPVTERIRRARSALTTAGDRLNTCAQSQGINLTPSDSENGLPALSARWQALQPKLAKPVAGGEEDILISTMDLATDIEQQTAAICGQPGPMDQALLLMSQNRTGAER